jgi:deoxyuridine 5'-triphosphate nucleotidohydrolase
MNMTDTIPLLRVKRLSEYAVIPTRGSQEAAGYDLYAAYDCEIEPQSKSIVKTDLAIAVPFGCYGRIAPRSSFAWKQHTDIGAGVVDSDYRGNVGVVVFNLSSSVVKVSRGDRIAQLILEKICFADISEVDSNDELGETIRGSGGFGSTGV